MKDLMIRVFKEEEGQGLTEYGLLVGLIALGVVAAVTALGGQISAVFGTLTDKLKSIK
ncbi:Flp family type IVb pilin [Sutcliffiella horikoshii]|uniref:Flp family type IVb pilin n=1 Tax=Sutcliffiella horikoshii TaxID=79883 RepID=A0A5D4T946_9BACI|nr:Flp family type IVb pilin [Sutcliffiella horikoshii]TYS71032.1 Flp family type IVb pilin [Sutcliffiella horikoshii]